MARCRYAAALFALAAITMSASCSGALLEDLSRVVDDPINVAPRAWSIQAESRIDLSWDEDLGADLYILQRAADEPTPSYATIYQGKATSYSDAGLPDQSRYLYRLVKRRGDRSFGPSAAAFGVSSSIVRDGNEPNDSIAEATELTYDRSSNIYFFRSFSGSVIQDIDWYSVSIPPQYKAYIVIKQQGLANDATSSLMFFQYGGAVPVRIVSGSAVIIENPSYSTGTYYFRVSPYGEDFIFDQSGAGGSIVTYSVSLFRIEKM